MNMADQLMEESLGKMETSSDSEAALPSKPSNLLFKLKMPTSSSSSKQHCVNAKQHICCVCSKGFSSGKALGGHVRIHMDHGYKNRKLISKLKAKNKKQRISNKKSSNITDDQYVSCCICNKNFRSMKSLFGHMRHHPERGWRGIRPPNSYGGGGGGSASASGSLAIPKWTRRTGMWISNEWISEEMPEAADSLMKLARGGDHKPSNNYNIVKSHDSVPWAYHKPAKELKSNNKIMKLINHGDGTTTGWFEHVDKFPMKQLANANEEEEEVGNILLLGNHNQNPSSRELLLFEEEEEEAASNSKPNGEGTFLYSETHHGKQVCSLRDFDLNQPYVSLDGSDEAAAGF